VTSNQRVSVKLREIAGDLAQIASNPPHAMDSQWIARHASQLLAAAWQVELDEQASDKAFDQPHHGHADETPDGPTCQHMVTVLWRSLNRLHLAVKECARISFQASSPTTSQGHFVIWRDLNDAQKDAALKLKEFERGLPVETAVTPYAWFHPEDPDGPIEFHLGSTRPERVGGNWIPLYRQCRATGELTEAEQLLSAWADLLPPNGSLYFKHTKMAREYFARRAVKSTTERQS
jgi:hypothetical protein